LGVSWNEGEIPLTQGETYYIDLWDSEEFTPYTQPAWNRYEDGQAFRNGEPSDQDLSMTIIQSPAMSAR
jgi:hypothetical protein